LQPLNREPLNLINYK